MKQEVEAKAVSEVTSAKGPFEVARRFLNAHIWLKRCVGALLYALAGLAAIAYWALPLTSFFFALLALLAIILLASSLGIDLRFERGKKASAQERSQAGSQRDA